MDTVLVSRSGGVVRWDDDGSPVGDAGNIQGVVHGLMERYNVVIYNNVYGNPPCEWVKPSTKGVDQLSTQDELRERYNHDVEILAKYNPKCMVNVVGAVPTSCWPGRVQPLAFAMRYTLPIIWAIKELELPRICVINDPRCYPCNHEMLMWPHVKPVCVLSQEDAEIHRKINHKPHIIKAVYSGAEHWWSYGRKPIEISEEKEHDVLVVAHSHLKDNRWSKGRSEAWDNILDDDYIIYGAEWKRYHKYNPEFMLGKIPPAEVYSHLTKAKMGPMMAAGDGFYTSKMRRYAVCGAAPVLYGRGDEYLTYDKYAKYVPHDSPWRIQKPGDLKAVSKRTDWAEWAQHIEEITRPDFSMLYNAVEGERYGGYFKA